MLVDDDTELKITDFPYKGDFAVVPMDDPVERITWVIQRMQDHIKYLERMVREEQEAKYKAFKRIAELTSGRG